MPNSDPIPLFKVYMPPREELMPALEAVLYSGQVSEGPPVYEFERGFASLVGAPDVLSFYSGTAALHAAVVLAGVRPGDEVISTALTAEPTNMAILHAGARLVWADIDPRSGNMDPDSVASVITPRTRAILPVHYGGVPVSIERLRAVATTHGIPVIEDAAHALGARYGGKPIGTHSEFVMFSLQAIKHMTTIDGGMLTCKDPAKAHEGRLLRWFGIDRAASRTNVDVASVGYKYHMNNVNATIGQVQLAHAPDVLSRHIENGRWFDKALSGINGVELLSWDRAAEPSYWFYTVKVDRPDAFMAHMTAQGIGASKVHKRNDLHSVFAASRRPLPGVDEFWERAVHIPCGWWVGEAERERIADALRAGW